MSDKNRLLIRVVDGSLAVLVASTTSSSVESPAILAGSNSSLGDDVAILALSSLDSYIANVTRTWRSQLSVIVFKGIMSSKYPSLDITEKKQNPLLGWCVACETYLLGRNCTRHHRGYLQLQIEQLHRRHTWCHRRPDCLHHRGRGKLQQSWVLIRIRELDLS